jgi:4-hydroxyphenylpyruvate dioxygenase
MASNFRLAIDVSALEMWVADLDRVHALLKDQFGFRLVPPRRAPVADVHEVRLRLGAVTVVVRQGSSPASRVGSHVEAHGDTVANVLLGCTDPGEIARRAVSRGLAVTGPADRPTVDVLGDGTIRHTISAASCSPSPSMLEEGVPTGIDHIAYCLPWGLIHQVADIYETVFTLNRIDADSFEGLGGPETGMRSIVLRSTGGFTVVLTEPAVRDGAGQTRRFVEAHGGPGVQHAALAYPDLIPAVESLSRNGVEFLPVPAGYYDEARRRLGDRPVPWPEVQRFSILADGDEHGLLYQLFTRPIANRGTFFLELIQRSGASGFGANNVRTLFAAVEAIEADVSQRTER